MNTMFNFTRHDYDPALDAEDDDRDLVLFINEARDPQEIDRLVQMGRQRARARRRASHKAARSRRASGQHLTFGRTLSLRH